MTPRDSVLRELIERNPNGLRLDRLPPALSVLSADTLNHAVEDLHEQGLIAIREHRNSQVLGRTYRAINLADVNRYPIREVLNINGRTYPRMIAGDVAGGDDLNQYAQMVGEIEQKALAEIEAAVRSLNRRYWITTTGVMSALLAVFALILRASEPLQVDGLSASEVFQLKAAELGPLALILFAFVIGTYLVAKLP